MPLISVIIPTYNRAHLVARAVYSVYVQTFRDVEILVIDDCSSDNTEFVLKHLASSLPGLDQMLVYHRMERNGGANAARNVGIRMARGEHVAFLDSDDIWHPEKLERHLSRMNGERQRNPGNRPIFSFTGRFRVDGDYRIIARQFSGSMRGAERRIRKVNMIGTLSSVMVNTWLARHVRGFDERLPACQDWDFYIRTIPFCHVLGVSDPLVMYFDGGIERISGNSRKRLASHLEMYRKYLRGQTSDIELHELYRNVAEDLERLGKHRMAERFYLRHKWLVGQFDEAAAVAFGFRQPAVLAERYALYAQREALRSDDDRERDTPYLAGYRQVLDAELDLPPIGPRV